jgi:RHS repeat-associated protein
LGSTAQLTGGTGAVTDSYVHDSWGRLLVATGTTTNSFRYVGRLGYYYNSDTGDYQLRARYYGSSVGRFLSYDPVVFASSTYNPYIYADNNPTTFVDPAGLQKNPAGPPTLAGESVNTGSPGECGEVDWGTAWKVTPAPGAGSSIIQKVTISVTNFVICDPCKEEVPVTEDVALDKLLNGRKFKTYWEGWVLFGGNTRTEWWKSNEHIDDHYRLKNFQEEPYYYSLLTTRGCIEWKGQARFYNNKFDRTTANNLPPTFVNTSVPPAFLLPATITDPKAIFPETTPFVTHTMKICWNCCPKSTNKKTMIVSRVVSGSSSS